MTQENNGELKCLFCGKNDKEVEQLIQGPEQTVLICNECVTASYELLIKKNPLIQAVNTANNIIIPMQSIGDISHGVAITIEITKK